MCYIDIQKAYDPEEFWALDRILEEYGFNQHFRNIIRNICKKWDKQVRNLMAYKLRENLCALVSAKEGKGAGCLLL